MYHIKALKKQKQLAQLPYNVYSGIGHIFSAALIIDGIGSLVQGHYGLASAEIGGGLFVQLSKYTNRKRRSHIRELQDAAYSLERKSKSLAIKVEEARELIETRLDITDKF